MSFLDRTSMNMYIIIMKLEWDEAKREANIKSHGFDFTEAEKVFDNSYVEEKDVRKEYNEERFILFGLLAGLIVNLVYTRRGEKIRIISLRRANKREREKYAKAIKNRLE